MAKRKASLDLLTISTDFNCQRDTKRLRRALETKYTGEGSDAPYIFLSLILYISKNEWGYYIENDENLILDLADETAKPIERIKHTIEVAAELGLIDQKLYERGIITSRNIQDDYFTIVEKLRRQIDVNNLPYLLDKNDSAESNSSALSLHNTEECMHNDNIMQKNVAECSDSSALSPHNTEECMHNDNIMQSNAEECMHNEGIMRTVKYSIGKYSKGEECKSARDVHTHVREHTHTTPPPIFFENQNLQKLWEDLLRQPNWENKTPEALEIASKTLLEYSPFVAMEMISHAIAAGNKEIYPPKDEMIVIAKRKEEKDARRQKSQKEHLPDPEENKFTFLDNVKSLKAKEMLCAWAKIIDLLPAELKDYASRAEFFNDGKEIKVTVPMELKNWIENKIMEDAKAILHSYNPMIKLFYKEKVK